MTLAFVLLRKLPILALFLVGTYYAVSLLIKLEEDTTAITNIAFGISATLTALSFSWVRTINAEDPLRDKLLYAAERFLHATIMLMTGSVLKYASLQAGAAEYSFPGWADFDIGEHLWETVVRYGGGLFVFAMFSGALNYAHTGLLIIDEHLIDRAHRYSDWDRMW